MMNSVMDESRHSDFVRAISAELAIHGNASPARRYRLAWIVARPLTEFISYDRLGPGESVNLAAALNQPVDTVANGEKRKASAGNRPGGSLHVAGRVFALPIAIAR